MVTMMMVDDDGNDDDGAHTYHPLVAEHETFLFSNNQLCGR